MGHPSCQPRPGGGGEGTQREGTHELVGEQEDRLERELAVAKIEQVLEARSEKVHDHGVVVALDAVPAYERDADATGERLVHLGLVLELRVLRLDRLELDPDLLARDDVHAEVDVACTIRGGGQLSPRPRAFLSSPRAGHVPKDPEPIFLPIRY